MNHASQPMNSFIGKDSQPANNPRVVGFAGSDFDLFASQLVVHEAGAGDNEARQQQLEILIDIPLLALHEEAV